MPATPPVSSRILSASWEYLLKKKDICARYIRESNPSLADSTTEESQAKAVREYAIRQDYIAPPELEFREAISAYMLDYTQRKKLMELLEAAKKKLFTVLVVSEVRAIGRKQSEIFVIYDFLKKLGIRIETINEKFEDDAMGRAILSLRATFSEIEREQTFMRTSRGRRDRLASGAVNGHPKPAYGYSFLNSVDESNACYQLNETIIYVDAEGNEWSEAKAAKYIFELAFQATPILGICSILNELGIPTPKKAVKGEARWQTRSVYGILTNRIYIGEVWNNKYKVVYNEKTKKPKVLTRPKEEWIKLAVPAPQLIEVWMFEKIQKQLEWNKQDASRNVHEKNVGILRAGFIYCGVCQRRLHVGHYSLKPSGTPRTPDYHCRQKGMTTEPLHNHATRISLPLVDKVAWQKVVEIVSNPDLVREWVAELRKKNVPVINVEDVQATIAGYQQEIDNLFALARHATTDDNIKTLARLMNDLERKKQQADALLYDIAEDDEERAKVEAEIVKFVKWADEVRPSFANPAFTPSYDEMRLAVRIIGIRVIVFPATGVDWPFRFDVGFTMPDIMAKMKSCIPYDLS